MNISVLIILTLAQSIFAKAAAYLTGTAPQCHEVVRFLDLANLNNRTYFTDYLYIYMIKNCSTYRYRSLYMVSFDAMNIYRYIAIVLLFCMSSQDSRLDIVELFSNRPIMSIMFIPYIKHVFSKEGIINTLSASNLNAIKWQIRELPLGYVIYHTEVCIMLKSSNVTAIKLAIEIVSKYHMNNDPIIAAVLIDLSKHESLDVRTSAKMLVNK